MKLLEDCSTELSKLREQYWMDELKPLYNEMKAFNPLSKNERVRAYQATDAYKKLMNTEEFKARTRKARIKHRAKKRALKSPAALL